jgi:hypothetical protein
MRFFQQPKRFFKRLLGLVISLLLLIGLWLMADGWLPLSLIRWEMTGPDDEVSRFWVREAMPVN